MLTAAQAVVRQAYPQAEFVTMEPMPVPPTQGQTPSAEALAGQPLGVEAMFQRYRNFRHSGIGSDPEASSAAVSEAPVGIEAVHVRIGDRFQTFLVEGGRIVGASG